MHVTLLKPSDAPQYRTLMLQAYELAADAFTSTPEERAAESESWWVKRIVGEGAVFGAFEGEELLGTVALKFSSKPKTKHKAHVIGMYVSPSARGSGAGKKLLAAAVAHARARSGLQVLTLTVTQGNEAAIGLYRSAGFEEFGIEPMAILTPSGFKAKVHMWRSLAATAA